MTMSRPVDHYRALGVRRDSGTAAIKAAYRAQVKKYHPDIVRASNGAASPRFHEIQEAFRILGDPQLRAEYDALITEQCKAKPAKLAVPPPAMAITRGIAAAVELSFWGGAGLLALLVAAAVVIEKATGH